MSLKSFDDFCARMVNNEPIQQKEIFDERQKLVRSQLTIRALWTFVIAACVNIIVMECGPQWCESAVLSTAVLGAAAYMYWVIANARRDTLFGIGNSSTTNTAMLFVDGLLIPIMFINRDEGDKTAGFFFRNGLVSENLLAIIGGVLLIIAAAVMSSSYYHHQKAEKSGKAE